MPNTIIERGGKVTLYKILIQKEPHSWKMLVTRNVKYFLLKVQTGSGFLTKKFIKILKILSQFKMYILIPRIKDSYLGDLGNQK